MSRALQTATLMTGLALGVGLAACGKAGEGDEASGEGIESPPSHRPIGCRPRARRGRGPVDDELSHLPVREIVAAGNHGWTTAPKM
jgi:hypothetical protein